MPLIRHYEPNKQAPMAGLYLIRTADKYRKIWEYLARFRSVAYCSARLSQIIPLASANHPLLAKKAEQIASAVAQAQSYFDSARNAGPEIGPLLAYYGIVGLSKCLILAGDNPYTLESTNPNSAEQESHGISWRTRNAIDEGIRDGDHLLAEFCYVRRSINSPGLYSLFRRCCCALNLPNQARYDVGTLLSLIPDLQKEVFQHLQRPPSTWRCRSSSFGQQVITDRFHIVHFDHYDAALQGAANLAVGLAASFPELAGLYQQQPPGSDDSFVSLAECASADDHIYVSRGTLGDQFAFIRSNGHLLTDFDTYFLLMFILSSLVRYRQDKWTRLLARMSNDEVFLVEAAVELGIVRFPWLVLTELEDKDYIFLAESTWG